MPRLPEGGVDCLSRPPFDVLRVNEHAARAESVVKFAQYGFDEHESRVYTAVQMADIDGDGVSGLVIGLPGARNREGAERAGAVLIVSTETGRELWRLEGGEPGESLGSALGYEGGLLRVDAAAVEGEAAGRVIRLGEVGIDNGEAGGDPQEGLPKR